MTSKPIQTSAAITINAPLAHVFQTAAAMDPCALIQDHGPLPGIVNCQGHTAPWSAIGQQRKHTLSDKSSADEELTAFSQDEHYAYRVTNFTGPFAKLVDEASGEWRFTSLAPETTSVVWTYSFTPRRALAAPALWLIVKLLWPGYLGSALARVKQKAEDENSHL
jgi:Polyketide cyclase / dehydrase and lipid transport